MCTAQSAVLTRAKSCRTSLQDDEDSPNVLVSMRRVGAQEPELKCIAINKVSTHCTPRLSTLLLCMRGFYAWPADRYPRSVDLYGTLLIAGGMYAMTPIIVSCDWCCWGYCQHSV